MSRPRVLRRIGMVPPQRAPAKVPPIVAPGMVPEAHLPASHVPVPPVQRPAGAPPNPRRLRVARSRGRLLDLFALFPDLPRPPRPTGGGVARRLITTRLGRVPR